MTAPAPPILPLRIDGEGAALVCVPPISGSPYAYPPLARHVQGRPMVALEAPGFDDDSDPVDSLPALSTAFIRAVRTGWPADRYVLLGWSMGGAVAFDMAHRLRAAEVRIPMLILVDAIAPGRVRHPTGRARVRQFVSDLLEGVGMPLSGIDAALAAVPDGVDATGTLTTLMEYGIFPEGFDEATLLGRYRVFDAHVTALSRHRATSGYDGPVSVLRARDSDPELMSWEGLATDVREEVIPGDHYSIWKGDGLVALSRTVQRALANT
ncbi:alpha/beta fold hydrolase [Micromonospora sp. NPDC005215]|uniref:thioesterase domain-containing protein n=1 Tax=Micromonospora sp. NPDC005215 TaxID=3157024 RepID=UPI0033A0DF30